MAIAGTEFLLRPIRPEDGERLAAFYAKASPGDMRLRFFLARREVPHSELARYCQIDYERDMTFVALTAPDGGTGATVMAGEVRAVCDPDNRQAEFAIQVSGPWQHKGLGTGIAGQAHSLSARTRHPGSAGSVPDRKRRYGGAGRNVRDSRSRRRARA